MTLTGTNAINGTGNAGANAFTGNSASNTLSGGAGNDTMNGGAGNDSLVGGTGNDSYVVDSTGDVISETSTLAGEIDSVNSTVTWTLGSNLERLTLSGTNAINGTGNTRANAITGNGASNILSGGVGNDTLNGGAGSDNLIGGTGNDSYVVDSVSDLITETSTLAGEIDSVSASVTWTLGSNLEKLTLTGTAAINGTGNALANTITGNAGNNKINGSAGNDTLSGGAGLDSFRFSSPISGTTNADTITDFDPATDTLELENAIFTKLTNTGALSTFAFRASTTGNAVDGNDYVLYDTDSGQLFYDADGSGAGAKVLIATLTNLPTLTSADIFVT
jgi:Ca2+-binding RTX toxin-like protein